MKRPPETSCKGGGRGIQPRHDNTLDLFPDLLPQVVPALWPTNGTRPAEALAAVIACPVNQAEYHDGWRLAAYIKELEYDGWRFIKRDIVRPGCRRAITEYSLDRSDPATAAALASREVR